VLKIALTFEVIEEAWERRKSGRDLGIEENLRTVEATFFVDG
jgi:hypothetical protein